MGAVEPRAARRAAGDGRDTGPGLGGHPLWLERHIGPGCAFRAVTGLPCPLCGGTHACAAWVQGDWPGAWAANPGAVGLLVWMGLAAAQWGMEGLLGGRRVRP